MTDDKNFASTRRTFLRGSAVALAAGGAVSRHQSGFAQTGAATPVQTAETTGNNGYKVANVIEFGAAGDYSVDDTAAIQAAINSLGSTGGTVYFPNGDYSVTAALTLSSSTELLGESPNARIHAQTPDAAIKVADTAVHNSDILIRRLNIRNGGSTPIGIDARYMSLCMVEDSIIDDFSQAGIHYGGNTNLATAAWSNSIVGSKIRNSPTCIYFNGEHTDGGSPANWMTIERCLIIPTNTAESVAIDLANGDTVRLVNNDIGYAPNATGIVIRKHYYAQLEYNRFEDIGGIAPSHQIEKEYGFSNFQLTGVNAVIHYQQAEFLEFTGGATGGTFILSRGTAKTGPIDFSADGNALAESILKALEVVASVGAGNVRVTTLSSTSLRIEWLNGRGRSNRSKLTADATGLTGGTTPTILIVQGSTADAIRQASDIALAGVMNDKQSPYLSALEGHLDIGIPVVARMPILAVRTPGASGFQLQRDADDYPRLELSVDGRIQWTNPDSGQSIGGLSLLASDAEETTIGWDDDLNVALPRRLGGVGDVPVDVSFRGSLHRYEGESGERDQLRVGFKDKDEATYFRHIYAGFPASGELDFPSIANGEVVGLTMVATGALVGDAVLVIPPTDLTPGLIATGFVSGANTVTIRVMNGSGEERGLGAGTWSVLVLQP